MATGSTSSDREVLLFFKRRTSEDLWVNRDGWNANATDLNSWFGVTAAANGHVVKLDLSTDVEPFIKEDVPTLAGDIPAELAQLSNLQELDLSSNQLTGSIPVEFAQLSNLTHLHLSHNQLTGSIPVELAQLSNLTHLHLFGNQFTGSIPVELAQLSILTHLHLSHNQLTGSIPAELAQLSNLTHLNLWSNQLTGIPVEFAQLSNLTYLHLSHNQLTGIPVELTQLSNLTYLHLFHNQLTGSIPVELAQLNNLTHLHLSGNQLTGIPVELAQLSNLTHLYLSHNQLTGSIPVELSQFSNLTHLHLSHNQLTGSIPVELAQLSNLTHLHLSSNQLTGIPVELAQLSNLEYLNLSRNQLAGSIPVELAQLSNLTHLHLSSNQLTGIPVELAQLSNLEYLDLSRNQLAGIPVELAQLSNVTHLHLFGNQFTGIPVELAQLSNLEHLDLSDNQLTGIPVELAQLSNLTYLHLSDNQLTGIPVEIARVSKLTHLHLSDNQLTGSIPVELSQLSNLTHLHLSDNQLTGSIPVELSQLSNLTHLHLSDNQLTGFGDVEDALKLTTRFLSIYYVRLDDNPWRMPPEAVVEQGLEAVKTYLNDVKVAKDTGAWTRSLQLMKVVLVGSSQAGKTSLINSIVKGRAAPTEGGPEEASTVGIELQTCTFGKTTVEFYDCAGQLDYAGMHQTFLSKRAVYLLVWDVTTCQYLSANSDLDKVIQEKIMPWLTILHLRAPKATVMLVANKCEETINYYSEIADKVEKRARGLLDEWQSKRGLNTRGRRYVNNLSWQSGRNLVSCQDYTGISELVQHIEAVGSTSIEVPPSWDLALTFVNVLRKGDEPLAAVSQHLRLSATPQNPSEKGRWAQTCVTKEDLSLEWNRVVGLVKPELETRLRTRAFSSQDNFHEGELTVLSSRGSALEGALWISEYAGHILRFAGGEGLFLDVVWLSKVLSPVLSHKLRSKHPILTALSKSRDHLINNGILRNDFARYLWRDVLTHSTTEEKDRIVNGIYRVLLKLGVVLPLGHTSLLGIDGHISRFPLEVEGTPQDVLVMMRLPDTDRHVPEGRIEACLDEAPEWSREVMLKWKFDSAGAPYGFVERLIASCHRLGEMEMALCWRFGAVFKSHVKVKHDREDIRLYGFLIRCDTVDATAQGGSPERLLALRMIGPLENERIWKALRYVASHMVILSEEWPGVVWEGWSECPRHPADVIYLATFQEAKPGDRLITEAARGCDCSSRENTVQGLVLRRLGEVIDTRKGDPFAIRLSTTESSEPNMSPGTRSASGRASASGPASAPHTPSNLSNTTRGVRTPDFERSYFRAALEIWRGSAWYFAGSLGSLALAIFLGVTYGGIYEKRDALWMTSSIVVGMLAVGAIVSSAVACQDSIENHRRPTTATNPPLDAPV